jgi:hypothetical protein
VSLTPFFNTQRPGQPIANENVNSLKFLLITKPIADLYRWSIRRDGAGRDVIAITSCVAESTSVCRKQIQRPNKQESGSQGCA